MEPNKGNQRRGGRKRERAEDESVEERKEPPPPPPGLADIHGTGGVPAPSADTFLGRVNNDTVDLSSLLQLQAQQQFLPGNRLGSSFSPSLLPQLNSNQSLYNADLLRRQLGGRINQPPSQLMRNYAGFLPSSQNALLLRLLATQNQSMAQGVNPSAMDLLGGVPHGASPFLSLANRVASQSSNSATLPTQTSQSSGSVAGPQGATSAARAQASAPGADSVAPVATGRQPLLLYTDHDEGRLTPYQCLARKHLEYFEADKQKVEEGAQGRNKAIVLGQVGIRCIHCSHLKRKEKSPAAAFYPSKLSGLYQSAQNIINTHLAKTCKLVPEEVRQQLVTLGNRKSAPGGGKAYWAEEAMRVGVFEDESGLRFKSQEQAGLAQQSPRAVKGSPAEKASKEH